ncbi:phytanoyl-CoA dioxygenase family protein [Pelagibius sp. Alg239-R121]|uniref:phytanoyl-CoA dioxygenase family protein n=1 Tax=Pelagibius sp. Alg239-R121 TaxID=2993448 RepID=UPI0024A759C6|nr:phytanoyl-CoA dioxygenase family protein [Pelagibius sp. Alg239-R121]
MLSLDQIQFFEDNGYLVADGLLDQQGCIRPVVEEYEALLDRLCRDWHRSGALCALDSASSFQDKIVASYEAGCDYFQPMDISLPTGPFDEDTPMHCGPAIFNLMTSPDMLDAVEALIGPEITSNPIQHVRIKPPQKLLNNDEIRAHITSTDWHQDRAVARPEADRTQMVTAWCAITEADEENGCLRVVAGSHRKEMQVHCPSPQVGIPARLIDQDRVVSLPVQSGGVIFFHPLTIHGSLPNRSKRLRWSFDLRFNRTGEPTGRPQFPDFVARSRIAPGQTLRDPAQWAAMWRDAHARLAGASKPEMYHRWTGDHPYCA